MQREWAAAERQTTELLELINTGTDGELVTTLDAMTHDQVRACVSHVSRDGQTALHTAAGRGRLGGLAAMLKCRADVNTRDGSGASPLLTVLSSGNLSAVPLLLSHGADVNETVCRLTGEGLLHRLVKCDRREAVNILLDHGVAVDALTRQEDTPLHHAARYRRAKMAAMLLRAGADINAINLLRETPLHAAIASKAFDVARVLVKHSASLALKDHRGMTALHATVAANNLDLARLMLADSSAQVNSKEKVLGRTPLLLACSHSGHKMATLLLAHGADANLTSHYRRSVLHVAAQCGNTGALVAVVKVITNLNALSINNKTALHCAVTSGHNEGVRTLLKAGVNVNLKDMDGNTALHLAAEAGEMAMVGMLLEHRVQIHVTNMRQQTAVHLAFRAGHEELGRALADRGADLHTADMDGHTAFDYWEMILTDSESQTRSGRSTDRLTDTLTDTTQRSVRFQDELDTGDTEKTAKSDAGEGASGSLHRSSDGTSEEGGAHRVFVTESESAINMTCSCDDGLSSDQKDRDSFTKGDNISDLDLKSSDLQGLSYKYTEKEGQGQDECRDPDVSTQRSVSAPHFSDYIQSDKSDKQQLVPSTSKEPSKSARQTVADSASTDTIVRVTKDKPTVTERGDDQRRLSDASVSASTSAPIAPVKIAFGAHHRLDNHKVVKASKKHRPKSGKSDANSNKCKRERKVSSSDKK